MCSVYFLSSPLAYKVRNEVRIILLNNSLITGTEISKLSSMQQEDEKFNLSKVESRLAFAAKLQFIETQKE